MSVTKITRNDGTILYAARWREAGRRPERHFPTKREAEAAERTGKERERARRSGVSIHAGDITYDRLCETFLDQHDASSREWLRGMLAYSRDRFGAVPVRSLHADEVATWLHKLQTKERPGRPSRPIAPKTKSHVLKAMRQVLAKGVEWGYLERNPARPSAVKGPKQIATEVQPFVSWAEVEHVARSAGARNAPLIVFACATGMRPAEMIALRWADVDLPARTCRVRGTKTAAADRTILLQRRALNALAALPSPLRTSQLVFTAPNGGPILLDNWRKRVWNPALKEAGLSHRPLYQMRHSFATLALAQGARIEAIGRQLGHSDISVTLKHYARFLPAADDAFLAALDTPSGRPADGAEKAQAHKP